MNTSSEKLDLFKINVYTSRYIIIMKQLEVINFEIFAKESPSIQNRVVPQVQEKNVWLTNFKSMFVLFRKVIFIHILEDGRLNRSN